MVIPKMAMLVYLEGGFCMVLLLCSPHEYPNISLVFCSAECLGVKSKSKSLMAPARCSVPTRAMLRFWKRPYTGQLDTSAAVLNKISLKHVKTQQCHQHQPSPNHKKNGWFLETIHKWLVYDIVLPTLVLVVGPTSPTLTWENCGLKLPPGWAEICFPPKKSGSESTLQ